MLSKLSTAAKQRLYALKSRSVRFFAFAAAAWAALPDLLPQIKDALPDLAPYLPDNVFKALSAIVIIGGIYYRLKTSQPVSAYKPDADKGQS